MLILTNHHHANKSGNCLIENFLINEKLFISKKQGVGKLQPKTVLDTSESIIRYLKNLTFTFEYSWTEDNYEDFLGTLNVRKDPKPEQLTFDNVILKESVIKSPWVLGIVLDNFIENN